ncbi:MAG: hypothetical protein J5856_09635 [Lachnospiraceae bacterium]|nr:hypothetical protein [Lachnospiraceae bacterium]
MASSPEEIKLKEEKKKIQDEKKKLKNEQKKSQQDAKKRAKELAKQEAELYDENSGSSMFGAIVITIVLILVWIGIFCLVVKLDIGGVGTNVFAPILKNIPVVKMILPKDSVIETQDVESYYGYTSLSDAVDRIKLLETELANIQAENEINKEQIDALTTEINRLKTFEANQVEFDRVKNQFYQEVVYSEKGPGPEQFARYYESIDPATAEYIYRQVVQEEAVSEEIKEYAKAYSEMKPKQAAAIFNAMTDNLSLAAKILENMNAEDRGNILGAMNPDTAAKITKIMEP